MKEPGALCVHVSPVGVPTSLDVSELKFKLYHQGNNFLSFFIFSKMGVHGRYRAGCLRTACACESILSRFLTHNCQSSNTTELISKVLFLDKQLKGCVKSAKRSPWALPWR